MTVERTTEGWQLRLRSQGFGRYVSGAFLGFWLCGWAVGETIVLWLLIKGAWALLTGTPPDPGREPLEVGPAVMVGVFLLVWLTLWTFGGIAAAMELMRLLWGEDRITVQAGRLTVAWIRGPFRTVRHFDRDAIHRISLVGSADRLSLETARRRVELSGLGSRPERIEGAAGLRAELGMAEVSDAARGLPEEWEEIITPEGERALVANLRTRRIQARVASIATMFFAVVTFVVGREAIRRWDLWIAAFILLTFTIGLTVGTLWLARGRWEWRIGSGRLTLRKRYGGAVKDVFEARHLMLDTNTDSDGDPWYELFALADAESLPARRGGLIVRPTQPRNSRSVWRMMTDASGVRALGAWLSRETGLAVDDRTTLQARQVELAEVRAMLESSGRFGRWMSKLMAPLGEKERRAK